MQGYCGIHNYYNYHNVSRATIEILQTLKLNGITLLLMFEV